jgi:hypothetical protein
MVFVIGIFFMLAPYLVSAAGLVPCGTSADPNGATSCQACNLVDLLQHVINFMLGLSIPIAISLFAYAGVLYFTSAANQGNIDKAKKIFRSAFLGFILALMSFIIVNTILHAVLAPDYSDGWNSIKCVSQKDRNTDANIGQLLGEVKDAGPTSCSAGYTYDASTKKCFNFDTGDYMAPTYPVYTAGQSSSLGGKATDASGTKQYADQLKAICAAQGFNDCATAQAIMAQESHGKASAISGANCVGLMQVCPGTARTLDPSLSGLSDAQITAKLMDPTYNMQLGVKYFAQLQSQFGATDNAIAAYNGGPKANTPSKTCPGQTYWQCTANDGYAETRNYVPIVVATRNAL